VTAKPPAIRPLTAAEHIFMMLYGVFSVGKTVLLGSTPGRVLIIRPPVDHTQSIHDPHSGLEEWIVHDWDEMSEVYEYLRMEGYKEYDWVWLDSISLWQDVGLDDIWSAVKERNPARDNKWSGKDKGEYGRNMDRLKEWIRAVVGLDAFNFGITAHPTEKLNDPFGARKMMPWVQGKEMSTGICGMMTLVAYYEVRIDDDGRAYRLLHTETTGDFYCKNQYTVPGSPWKPIKNPTMEYVLSKIEEHRKRTNGAGTTRRRRRQVVKGAS
jgi:hypothetical protein